MREAEGRRAEILALEASPSPLDPPPGIGYETGTLKIEKGR